MESSLPPGPMGPGGRHVQVALYIRFSCGGVLPGSMRVPTKCFPWYRHTTPLQAVSCCSQEASRPTAARTHWVHLLCYATRSTMIR